MAKRFTDTKKWAKQSFQDLSLKMKLVWVYLCDNCDHAGIWDINMGLLSFQIGEKISLKDITEGLGERVDARGSKMVLTGFVDFQYGDLNPENRVHQSVLTRLENIKKKGLVRSLQGSKDKDKDKDKEKEGGLGETKIRVSDLIPIYEIFPRKEGKSRGLKILLADLKTKDDVAQCLIAVTKFRDFHRTQKTEPQFIPHFKTWAGSWRDCLEPSFGTAENFSSAPYDSSHLNLKFDDDEESA